MATSVKNWATFYFFIWSHWMGWHFWILTPMDGSSRFQSSESDWEEKVTFFKKWDNPSLFFIYFRSFQTKLTIFITNKCEKCPSSLQRWESNPRPLIRESLPITTRPARKWHFYALRSPSFYFYAFLGVKKSFFSILSIYFSHLLITTLEIMF